MLMVAVMVMLCGVVTCESQSWVVSGHLPEGSPPPCLSMCLQVDSSNMAAGTRVILYGCTGKYSVSETWTHDPNTWQLKVSTEDLLQTWCLDIDQTDHSVLIANCSSSSAAQQWVVEDGYRIRSAYRDASLLASSSYYLFSPPYPTSGIAFWGVTVPLSISTDKGNFTIVPFSTFDSYAAPPPTNIGGELLRNGAFEQNYASSPYLAEPDTAASMDSLLFAVCHWGFEGGAKLDYGLWPKNSADSNGSFVIELNGLSGDYLSYVPGRIWQTVRTVSGTRYSLSFKLSGNGTCQTSLGLRVWANPIPGRFNYSVKGGMPSDDNMQWETHTLSLTAISNITTVQFQSTVAGACGPLIDDISLVPIGGIPSSLPPPPPSNPMSTLAIGVYVAAAAATLFCILGIATICYCRRHHQHRTARSTTSATGTKKKKTHTGSNDPAVAEKEEEEELDTFRQGLGVQEFSVSALAAATQSFRDENIVGKGGFGNVYLGQLGDGRKVAVKVLSENSNQGKQEFLTEVVILSRAHHSHVVPLIGFCWESGKKYLVYDFMEKGSVMDHLRGSCANSIRLGWLQRLNIALDAAKGLEYLHWHCNPRIIHRDVKTNNILLDNQMRAKISDFGISKVLPSDHTHASTNAVRGTLGYMDPEYCKTCKLTDKSDVYSYGVVLLTIISGHDRIIHSDDPNDSVIHIVTWAKAHADDDIVKIVEPSLKDEYNMNVLYKVVDLAFDCVQDKGSERPSMTQVVQKLEAALQLQSDSENHSTTMTMVSGR